MLHSGLIPASKTRGPIRWTFLESGDRTATADGSLTVTEDVGKTVCRLVSSRYDVAEDIPPPGVRGRVFLYVKTDHRGDLDTVKGKASAARIGEVYECRVFDDGQTSCTCTAGQTEHARPGTGKCVHQLTACSLVDGGVFDDNFHAPAARAGTEYGEWGDPRPPDPWWAEAAGGRLVPEPLGC